MRYLSICSGIEAATVAWHDLGWTPLAFSEIEPFPSAVLAHHYPNVPNVGDMTKYKEWNLGQSVDLLVGGTPCQAFSVAGLRQGLADARGNLTLTFVEMADHFDPEWIVWENVPGVLSSKDNAFGCFLAGLCGADDPFVPNGKWASAGVVSGPKRTVAWRVLDAQFFGVAQRRRRIFVLAVRGARNWRAASALFPIGESMYWDTAPSRETRKVAPTIPSRSSAGGGLGTDFDCDGGLIQTFDRQSSGEYGTQSLASTMSARDYKSPSDLVSYGIPGNWIGRAPENGGNAVEPMHDVAPCLTKTDQHGVAHPTPINTMVALRHEALGRGTGFGIGEPGDPAYTMTKGHSHAVYHGMAVRRLTPVECERLQGFPDNYTNIPWRKQTTAPDGPRYKALGNSMAVPVMNWLGRRIASTYILY